MIAAVCSTLFADRAAAQATEAVSYSALVALGKKAFGEGDFAAALGAFERAHALQPSARTWRGMGGSAFELHRYTEAKQQLEQALADRRHPLTAAQRLEVEKLLDWMRASLASLQLSVAPDHALISIDDHPTRLRLLLLEAGVHRVAARADGYEPLERSITLSPHDPQSLSLELVVRPAEPSAPTPPAGPAPADHAAARPVALGNAAHAATGSGSESRKDESKLFEQWWFWTAVCVVAVGGVIAGVALTRGSDHATPHVDAMASTLRVAY